MDDENIVSIIVQNGKGVIKNKIIKNIEVTSDKTVKSKIREYNYRNKRLT